MQLGGGYKSFLSVSVPDGLNKSQYEKLDALSKFRRKTKLYGFNPLVVKKIVDIALITNHLEHLDPTYDQSLIKSNKAFQNYGERFRFKKQNKAATF